MVFIALAPLGERVARIRRYRHPGGPGEGVSPIVNSYVGHHTSHRQIPGHKTGWL